MNATPQDAILTQSPAPGSLLERGNGSTAPICQPKPTLPQIGVLFDKKRTEKLEWLATDHPLYLNLFMQVFSGKASARKAIKAFCLDCYGWQRKCVTECRSTACPLWNLRPYQKTSKKP